MNLILQKKMEVRKERKEINQIDVLSLSLYLSLYLSIYLRTYVLVIDVSPTLQKSVNNVSAPSL